VDPSQILFWTQFVTLTNRRWLTLPRCVSTDFRWQHWQPIGNLSQ